MTTTSTNIPLTAPLLKQYFLEGSKKESDLKIGVEWEKVGVLRESGKAVSYSGQRGVEVIFKALIRQFNWAPAMEGPHIIGLEKQGSFITLEPGGQIELSGRKAKTIDENSNELLTHLEEIKTVSDPMDIAWLGVGLQPMSPLDKIEWIPKERYKIMSAYFKKVGTLSHFMMKQTAAIQIALDFLNEQDAIRKLQLGMGLAPFLTAIFANSPISEGRLNGYQSKRAHIWSQTAPERTGIIPRIFNSGYTLEDYIEYALNLPMLFIVRHGKWIEVQNIPFKDFLKNGFKNETAVPADWDLHLSSIFTETRLRKYLEVRSIDAQKAEFGLAAPAIIKGLFYDEESQRKALDFVLNLTDEERRQITHDAALKGIHAAFRGKTLWNPCTQLLQWAEEGLQRLEKKGLAGNEETRFLLPLKNLLVNQKKMPAQIITDCFKEGLTKKEIVQRIIHCSAI